MPPALPQITLAAALNALLDAQPAALNRLQRHADKALRLALPVLPIHLALDANGRFQAAVAADAAPDLILTPLPSALPLLLHDGKLADLFHIEGDGLFAADLSGALADFDWVLALRPYLGDIVASRVDQFLRGLVSWRQQAHADSGLHLAEYAIYEQALLAEPLAARDFVNAVDCLREDVDRFAARLQHLEEKR
jgi:ubiquinone biosynthesis protein UbiJ